MTQKAFTLVEIIAVVAIIGFFAVVLLRALIREIDARYVRQERASLKAYSDALQRGIMRHGYIPDHTTTDTGWARTVANETGADLASIAQNSRQKPRILLIDPGDLFAPGAWSPPYTQTVSGILWLDPYSPTPKRARFMLASSVGKTPLPISPGLLSTNDFDTLWNTAPGATPATTNWTGFPPQDLVLERIDLSPRIVMLSLTTDSAIASQRGQYSIGTNTTTLQTVDDRPRLFLENTVVGLHHSDDYVSPRALDSQHVLIRGASFRYANHVWVSGDNGGPMYGGLDLAAVARQFLTCVPNLNAPTNQQLTITKAMINYMRDYVAWREVGGSANNTMFDRLVLNQQVMMVEAQKIFKKNLGRYPVNASAPCP